MKFKKGDRVKVVKDCYDLGIMCDVKGEFGTIVKIDGSRIPYCVKLDDQPLPFWFCEQKLELVEEEKTLEFKVGDRVKVSKYDNYGCTGNALLGREGFIKNVDDRNTTKLPYLVKLEEYEYWLNGESLELIKEEPNEPKNVTFRIKAIKDDDEFLTKGKIYEFVDGRITFDCGMKSSKYRDFEHFIRINGYWKDFVIELGDYKNHFGVLAEGDEIRVTKKNGTYSRYINWSMLGGWSMNFVDSSLPSLNKIYKVILIGKHDGDDCTLTLIQDQDTTQVFIMGVEDLELIKKHEVETK